MGNVCPMKDCGAAARDLLELSYFALSATRPMGLSVELPAMYVRVHDSVADMTAKAAEKHGGGTDEAADVMFHLMALMQAHGLSMTQVIPAVIRKIDSAGWPSVTEE